jgi:predicted nucleic acid-binding protein
VIVSNAGPLIVLLKTGKISILKGLFQKVLVPTAVWEEITAKDYEKSIFVKMEWIETKERAMWLLKLPLIWAREGNS